jgi:hypothetical protein
MLTQAVKDNSFMHHIPSALRILLEPPAEMVVLERGHGVWWLVRLCVAVQPGGVALTTVGMAGEARVALCADRLRQHRGE